MNQLTLESKPAYASVNGEVTRVYNEAAFRYFLTIERKRAERSVRPLLLVLVTSRKDPQNLSGLHAPMFATIFSSLIGCVREVDFVGWYREGTVAAAALLPSSSTPDHVQRQLGARVVQVLRQKLSAGEAARLDVRVVELDPGARI